MRKNLLLDLIHLPKQGCKLLLTIFTILFTVTLTEASVIGIENYQSLVRGVVIDSLGTPITGATVTIKGSTVGTQTNSKGEFSFPNIEMTAILTVTYTGYLPQDVPINNQSMLTVVLKEDPNEIGEVVVVAFGQQKKETLVGSITNVNPKELKGPTSNLTTMLAGRVSGVIGYQRSGEPGQDNASFFIRGVGSFGTGKVDPLILLNGMEISANEMARIQPDDIEGFSVLKDASAAALYGARGANGVILVTTKSGKEGPTKINMRLENSVSSNTQNFKLADNLAYMRLSNEAIKTRDPLGDEPYSQTKIDMTELNRDPYLFPNNDWMALMIKDYTNNTRVNGNISGGGAKGQYYIAGTANIDNGVLKNIEGQGFNSNVKATNYEARSNVNFKLAPTTEAIVRMQGQFYEYNGPIGGGSAIFNQVLKSDPVSFPAYFPSSYFPGVDHILFGNAPYNAIQVGGESVTPARYVNPLANSLSGYQLNERSYVTVQGEIKQNLDFITKGLNARIMGYTRRNSEHSLSRSQDPFYYTSVFDKELGFVGLEYLKGTPGTPYLSYTPGSKLINKYNYVEAALNYNGSINKSDFGATLIYLASHYQSANEASLQLSLPKRNQGISGRVTYGYDSKYLAEVNFGYNGSERFWGDKQYGFFPSVGLAWNIHNESFFKPVTPVINKFKLRGTYGLVGNDQIGNELDRFFFLANVNLNTGGYTFGYNYDYTKPGVAVTRYENRDITWETSYKSNVALELGLFNSLNLEIDAFRELYKNVLMTRSYIPVEMGLTAAVQANVGESQKQGVDMSVDYTKSFYNNTWLTLRGNFTYASSKYLKYEEPNYNANSQYLSRVGNSIHQSYGYIAERLFIDDYEVANSPTQFEDYKGGDIKYKDINGDGIISALDRVPIGQPTVPEVIYGFGFSYGIKNLDINAFFQGSARSSLFISPSSITPFVTSTVGGLETKNGLLDVIANSHWSEDNRDIYAFFPRLSNYQVTNNNQTSTWWMRDGSFMRLKSVEVGYNIKGNWLKRVKLDNIRLYASGLNLLSWSKFKLWDVEMGGNGLGYPIQRVYNFGMSIGL
jgi:TonB-linked SusC/RagA family outer membrane protein